MSQISITNKPCIKYGKTLSYIMYRGLGGGKGKKCFSNNTYFPFKNLCNKVHNWITNLSLNPIREKWNHIYNIIWWYRVTENDSSMKKYLVTLLSFPSHKKRNVYYQMWITSQSAYASSRISDYSLFNKGDNGCVLIPGLWVTHEQSKK
jgi:hypothetical protein